MSLSTSLVFCLVVLVLCRWTAGKSCSKSCPSPLVLYTANCVCVPSFVQCFRQDETDCPAVTKAKFCNTPTYMVSCPHSCGLCKSDYVPSSKLAIAFFPSGKSALDMYLGNCGAPPRLANGVCRATHGKLSDVATCACIPGYKLAGHGLSHCQKNWKWSAHASTCIIKNCGSPPVVARATVSAPVTTFGATATYTCNVGFRLRSSPFSRCKKDGTWTAMGRICTLHDCGAPKALPNAVSSSPATTVGRIATYTCKPGYTASGTRTILCKAGGTWATTNFKCTIKNCGTPTAVTDATVSAPTTTFGSTATYTCNQGFTRRSGYLKVVCLSSARWSTNNLKCSKFAYINGYVLGMRIIPGNGVSSANTWKNPSIKLDFPVPASLQPGCLGPDTRLPCKTHFRSTLVNYWSKIGLQRVRVVLLKNRKAVRTLDFNAKGTNYLSWFSRSKLIRSTWKNLPYKYSMNHFKILGPSSYRNWYINRASRTCSTDDGWLVVKDSAGAGCPYDKGKSFPRIKYSNTEYHQRATRYATADTMLILLKLATDVCGPPPTVKRSTVKYTSLAVGAKAVYTCHTGFQATRTPSINCLADSTWTKVYFSCEPNTCASVKKCNAKKDGEYWIYPTLLKGASLKVYCYNMKSRSPMDYITLVKRNYANYPATRNTKCTGKDVPLPKPNKSGVTTFSKVRIYVSTMQVIRSDLRFARSTGTVQQFGVAYACHSKLNKCKKKGVTVVDFRGTGLGIKSTAIFSTGLYGSGYYSHSGSKEYYKLVCGGYCGGCYMPGSVRMKRIYSPKASSATKVNC
ncbi:sushi, von Willebrand factor type A, EGF and pentraxin domain-containing protein 1-like isoform X2 [Haliotis rufescens]|uniref:sushi, von Willebrand factor type A, EGF and pentraxin domain-containing protein 1-like isoform X2 n=1 Tax=Haliotis rufescens TaxID=6454 RepID=UPI00201F340B|nr:sushi, von Willebrand factor type A, EGF and pentraxin domain-containing protein 1-like isoform X2 [Haliotis rufescens]